MKSAQFITVEEEALLGPDPEPTRGAVALGPYEGAERFSRDLALWQPPLQSVDMEILPHKGILDSRAKDMIRNDAYVQGGSDIHQDSIVGAMYLLNAKPHAKVLGWTEERTAAFQEEVESKFTLWAESPMKYVDAARMNTLTALVRLAVGVEVMGGEVLATIEWIRQKDRPFHTAIQMIDADRLSTPWDKINDHSVRGGVAKNGWGEPTGYYIRLGHPSEIFQSFENMNWKLVPARKPWGRVQVIHILQQQRPDQSRGISALVAALKEMKITKKFRDIVLQNAVVNATFAASIESELPPAAVYQSLGAGTMDEDAIATAIQQYAGGYLNAISAYAGGSRNMHIDGVKIPHLYPGTKLNLRGAGAGGPLGTEFEQSLLRYIAATLGVSYEELSRDYTKTNYSSARAAMNNTHKHMQSRKRATADQFATLIFRSWLEEAINQDQIDTFPASEAGTLYENGILGMRFEALSACDWIGASRGQIDELKETQAAVLRIKYNLTTWEEELARLGQDWRKVFAQRKREKEMLEGMDLLPLEMDKDNMMSAASGDTREGEAKGEPKDGSGDNADA